MNSPILHAAFALALLAGLHNARAATAMPATAIPIGAVSLCWNASTCTNVAGYNIYLGTNSGTYIAEISVGNVTNASISNLTAGVVYYFAATTLNSRGDESSLSNQTAFLVPGILTLYRGAGAGCPMVLNFPVEPAHSYEIQATTNFLSWNTIGQTGLVTSNAWYQFTDTSASSYSSRFYRLVLN
jgi:hypothetical protein